MKNILFYLILFFTVSCFFACTSDDDEDNSFTLTIPGEFKHLLETDVSILTPHYIQINRGTKPFTIKVENESIANAEMYARTNDSQIEILANKLGTTSLLVTDAKGVSNQLVINVIEEERIFESKGPMTIVEGDIAEDIKEEIIQNGNAQAIIQRGGCVKFVFNSKEKGIIKIWKTEEEHTPVEGTFELCKSSETDILEIIAKYYNESHLLVFQPIKQTPLRSRGTPNIFLYPYMLFEDLTNSFKEKYPQITSLKIMHSGGLQWR